MAPENTNSTQGSGKAASASTRSGVSAATTQTPPLHAPNTERASVSTNAQPTQGAAAAPTEAPQPARKPRRAVIVAVVVALVAAVAGAAWWLNRPTDDWYDSGMSIGNYEGKTQDEIIADLNAQVAENEMNISCAPEIPVDAATGEAMVRMENIAANHVDQKFTITLEDGTVLYESGAVAPGNYVQSVTLTTVPEPGDYTCTVTFQGYDPDTHEPRGGSAALAVPLKVS